MYEFLTFFVKGNIMKSEKKFKTNRKKPSVQKNSHYSLEQFIERFLG